MSSGNGEDVAAVVCDGNGEDTAVAAVDVANDDDLPIANVKIVAVGDGNVGKTCLCNVFAKGQFIERHVPTIFESEQLECIVDNKVP